jgi:hypothetical protein
MKIYSKVVMKWDNGQLVSVSEEAYEYAGQVALACGATNAQNQIQQQQSDTYKQMTQQAQQVFGNSSQVFNDLMNTFAPTVAAGPNQEGFSAAEKANLESQAITQTGQAYKNAKEAVGNAQSAQGGGNTGLTSGAEVGTDLSVANSAAEQTANELGQITEADYQTGRQNYLNATQGIKGATDAFNPATSSASAATNSGEAAATTANNIATQDNSWMQAVSGALGQVGGAVVTGGMSNLGKGLPFFGKSQ